MKPASRGAFSAPPPPPSFQSPVGRDNMASGVKVDEEVRRTYDDIKKKKSYRYLVFYIKDEKMICVEKIGERESNYNDFLHDLTIAGPGDCRSTSSI